MVTGRVMLKVVTSSYCQTQSSQPNDLKFRIGDNITGYINSAEFVSIRPAVPGGGEIYGSCDFFLLLLISVRKKQLLMQQLYKMLLMKSNL